ncbi:MAG: hypothetical protein ACK40L_10245 [Hydrogenophaga sp.]
MTASQLEMEFDRVIAIAATSDSNLRIVELLAALKQTALISLGQLPMVGERLEINLLTRVG